MTADGQAAESRADRWLQRLQPYLKRAEEPVQPVVEGRLKRMVGLTLEAEGCQAALGDRCRILGPRDKPVDAEVVGFSGDNLYLMPIGNIHGLAPKARVIPMGSGGQVALSDPMLGRVFGGTGQPLDGRDLGGNRLRIRLSGSPINPLARHPIHQPLDVGVRAINALLTVGRGQRMGLFAGSGVGKSVLLGMMTKFTNANVVVVGLIGERGREVKEFIENILGPAGMARAVVVASPADDPPLMRIHGASLATAIAEYYRDQGMRVLLLMDSLTRFAQAQREIALAIGEPPATRGYPPSVFARIPQLVERAGNGEEGGGSITAFYTVLTEVDDQADPIADAARAILNGHIVLSRRLADAGHYPAIDIEASISRAMTAITDLDQQHVSRSFKRLYSLYQQNQDVINVGAYTPGTDPGLDRAIAMYPRLMEFLHQGMDQRVSLPQSLKELNLLLGSNPQGEERQRGGARAAADHPAGT